MVATVIACKTIETELLAAMKKTGVDYPVLWLEPGLHNTPKKLKAHLEEVLQTVTEGYVLLAMGSCGNALVGISAEHAQLVVPKVDDCISLLLGSMQKRQKIGNELAAYFLTDGWMRGERNLWVEHQYTVEKYGEEQAMALAKMLYGHYRTLALLDSGISPVENLVEETKIIAETFSLKQEVVPATLYYLEELLLGSWDSTRFAVKSARSEISVDDFICR